jgi:ferric-chelate reductase
VQSSKTVDIPTYLDGPYGASVDVSCYPTVLGIAGGTGITHILSHAIHLLALVSTQQSPLRHLHIIWNIRHASHVEWIAPLLNTHFANLPTTKQLRVTIEIHVTRESVSNDAGEEQIHLGEAFEGVLEALPNHMRRERRRSMAMQMQVDDDDEESDASPFDRSQERRPILRSSDSFLTEEQEVRYTKRGDRHGLSDEVWRLIRWTSGRAQLKGYVRKDIDSSDGDLGLLGMYPARVTTTTS